MEVTTPQIEEMQFLFPGKIFKSALLTWLVLFQQSFIKVSTILLYYIFLGGGHHENKQASEASSPDAEVTLRDELSNGVSSHKKPMKQSRSRTEGLMSKSMQGSGPTIVSVMSNSLPSYDLKRLFKGQETLQVSVEFSYELGKASDSVDFS